MVVEKPNEESHDPRLYSTVEGGSGPGELVVASYVALVRSRGMGSLPTSPMPPQKNHATYRHIEQPHSTNPKNMVQSSQCIFPSIVSGRYPLSFLEHQKYVLFVSSRDHHP
jgi:hypothetical protein